MRLGYRVGTDMENRTRDPLPDTAHLRHFSHELATDAIARIWPHIDPVVILNCLWSIGLSASHIPIGSGIAHREDFYSLKLDSLQGEGLAETLPAPLRFPCRMEMINSLSRDYHHHRYPHHRYPQGEAPAGAA